MNYLHPLFAVVLLTEAFLVLWLIQQWVRVELVPDHYSTIDGLRGFLAFGVFIHHSSIWYAFLKSGAWAVPESRLYTHLGQSTVTLFFMITGFLFYRKVLESKTKPIDWVRLYISRCMRILPLYLFVMLAGTLIYVLIQYSSLLQPLPPPWSEKSLKLLFTAGVTWTLSYEWKFYFALPLMALTMGRVSWKWLMFSAMMLLASGLSHALNIHALAFASGILAATLSRVRAIERFAISGWGSIVAVICLLVAVSSFDTAYAPTPLLLLSIAFVLIANGSRLWGLLTANLTRTFGEMTYSIYLLHGPLLFLCIRFVLGFNRVNQMSPTEYWCMIGLLTPVLIGISAISYKRLELPFMRMTTRIAVKLNTFWRR